MVKYSLDGLWQLRILGENVYDIPQTFVEAAVPGSVFGTYLEKGMMPDPYYRDNELEAVKLSENDFEYVRFFEVTEEQLTFDKLLLVFEGIDTLADIYLNSTLLGRTCNMHIRHEFDVLSLIKAGENELRVVLHSPVKYIRQEQKKVYTGGSHECMEGYPHLRKAHCMFGWDWGPRLPDAGIYRPVYLCGISKARIENVYVTQLHSENRVELLFDVQAETLDSLPGERVTVTAPGGTVYVPDKDGKVTIENPLLWWPNGYGTQPLYTVKVELVSKENGEVLDIWEKRIGLRTMTVNTGTDEWGEKFAHQVNGLDIFAMGADYIPEDNLFGRISKERTEQLLRDAVAAHHNSIRVWGGGYYLDDYFYDICDELGLLVWQDFMFACSSYELDEAFDANIREEITQVIRRLRHHACLALWCGNNEIEAQTLDNAWLPSKKQVCDYTRIFEYIIPEIVKKEDPQTFYWPSSPSSGGNFDNPSDENRGDTHYWDVWHGDKPFTAYRNYRFRYVSEFGFQSFPCMKTVETFTEPEDRNIFSRVMEMHQRNPAANGKIMNYLSQTYLYPKDFDSLLYASQLLQMEAIRYGVEHFRRYRGRCMGTIVWQLNDIWPVASWASIDYYGRWKALHYAECRMFAPVMISCEEVGEMTERPYCILERVKPIEKSARLHVANETLQAVTGTVYWELRTPDAAVLKEGSIEITVPALDGVWLDKLNFSDYDERGVYLSYRFEQDSVVISQGTALFTPPKHFRFENPRLQAVREGNIIRVTAEAYAKSVEIEAVDGDVRFSDNYFDMNAGITEVKIVSGNATEFRVRSVYDLAN
ncbi:MAG: glycosyl hydrolase 2 galactose-binding domain-containing protein [Lachnospiraceae bacterium]